MSADETDWAAGEYQLCACGRSELGCTGGYDWCRNPVDPAEVQRRFALRYPAMVRQAPTGEGCNDAVGSEVAQVRRPPEG